MDTMTKNGTLADMAEAATTRVEDAVREGIDALVDAAGAKAGEISAGYARKAEAYGVAEAAMFEAQTEVDRLVDGRAANVAAIAEAMVDDDQERVKALQRDEKARKKDLAGAEGALEKAQARYAAAKVEGGLYVEALASEAAIGDLERELQAAVSGVAAAARRVAGEIAVPRLDRGGVDQESQRLFPRGEEPDMDLYARRRAELLEG